MCKTEICSLIGPVHVGTIVHTSDVYLCKKKLKEGSDLAKTLLLRALLDIHQSKPMRVNLKEPVGLGLLKNIEEIRRFLNKERSVGTLERLIVLS